MNSDLRLSRSALLGLLACAVVVVSAPGCFLFGGGRPRPTLASNDPGLKIPAIKKASDARDTETARQLVASLDSDDPAIRFYSIRGLQDLTGETFGYIWYLDEPQRRAAAEKWKRWIDANDGGSLAGGNHDSK